MKSLFFFVIGGTTSSPSIEIFSESLDDAYIDAEKILGKEYMKNRILMFQHATQNFECLKCNPPEFQCNYPQ